MTGYLSVAAVRELFLTYFESKQHTRVESSSLIPHNDPTLLFTNAGMNQFKDTFLGLEKRPYTRAVSSQKCVRAGGKHNDLDNVGYTARHHTFFEMLGNFSFGDYFKQDAISYAWEFLTSPQWLNIPADRLYVTAYHTDDEAVSIWHNSVGIPLDRIIKIGDNKGAPYASDNFWAMGDTGPCGPCTEIFYDHGAHIPGGLPGTPEEDGDRFIEIWNIVFMQFNRSADGQLHALPAPCVDTGMGLERIAAVMQHVNSNYDIDLFKHLVISASAIVDLDETTSPSLRVLADHIRSCAFLIADGVVPSNEGRGYVLRRIIRRAIRHGNKLGAKSVFFYRLVESLVFVMGEAYPSLVTKHDVIVETLKKEEEQFAKTLEQGLKQFESAIADPSNVSNGVIAGSVVFKLYDTYGFPSDLTADIARERDLRIDEAGFEVAMNEQRQRARESGKFVVDYNAIVNVDTASEFVGYTQASAQTSITAMYKDGKVVDTLTEGDEAIIVLNQTPFYAESGGQVGDTGKIIAPAGVFEVQDTKKSGHAIVHRGVLVVGSIAQSDTVDAQIDNSLRASIVRNHSATHLLHAALRNLLGTHVEQKGSLVTAEGLRFDFAHTEAVSADELRILERKVTEVIVANTPVTAEQMSMDEAVKQGAMALFGEKYGDTVRVLSMGNNADKTAFSVELCGGVHVNRTGDIGGFKIVSEAGIAAGIRRIEAKTGLGALAVAQQDDGQIAQICQLTKSTRLEVATKVGDVFDKVRDLEKQLEQLSQKLATAQTQELLAKFVPLASTSLLVATVAADNKTLRLMIDSLKSQCPESVLVLVGQDADKLAFVASVPSSLTAKIKAGDIVKYLADALDGKGGGKPDFAQGGANANAALPEVVAALPAWIQAKV